VTGFFFVSGRLCLELVGTRLWRRSRRTELLDRPDSLARWAVEADVVDRLEDADSHGLARITGLREVVYELAADRVLPPELRPSPRGDVKAIDHLNDAAGLPLPRLRMTSTGTVSRAGRVDEVLGAVARDAIELLASPDAERMKECANPECTRLFVDLSRSFARRWCGMAECGNRHKAATYRQRRREEASG
jgi:predicted RNA-binding Zn ribbon-like protein